MNKELMSFVGSLLANNFHFTVTSAKRSPEDNKKAGGVPNSQHLVGEAIDIKPYGLTTYNLLFSYSLNYSESVCKIDQLILYPSFIHISFGARNRGQIIDKRKLKNK